MPKVSVLIPIYNVENFLSKCLNSIVNQTLTDIEIICINDGSNDLSKMILEDYASRDSRIKVLHKHNTGYGDSLNIAIGMATGEYIGIVEPDDFANHNMFERLYTLAKLHDVDVVKSSFSFYWSKPKYKFRSILPDRFYNKVLCPEDHPDVFDIAPTIWTAIYRREMIEKNNIRFLATPGASYQDTAFSFKVWASAQSAYFIKESLINYRQDNENASVVNKGKVFCVCEEFEEIDQFLKLHHKEHIMAFSQKRRLYCYFWNIARLSHDNRVVFIEQTQDFFFEMWPLVRDKSILVDRNVYKKLSLINKNLSQFLFKYRLRDLRKSIKVSIKI